MYFITHTHRNTCTHMDRELHLHLLMLWAQGDMENYRERTLVASILSLVSEKCDLKGRRIKRDKLFWTTVNKGELLKPSAQRGKKKDIMSGFSWVQRTCRVKIKPNFAEQKASIYWNMNVDGGTDVFTQTVVGHHMRCWKMQLSYCRERAQWRQWKATLSSYICTQTEDLQLLAAMELQLSRNKPTLM